MYFLVVIIWRSTGVVCHFMVHVLGFSQGQDLLFSDAFNCFLESLGRTILSDWGRWIIWENSIDRLKIESIFQMKSRWRIIAKTVVALGCEVTWGDHVRMGFIVLVMITYIPTSWQRWCIASPRQCWGPRYQTQQISAQWSKSIEPYSSETETATEILDLR